ncbi:DUF4332 domain-containing protein [Pasteurella sp. PK-2025]|uniref:DUF4332 domain-containing protein n=1 Tax=Pasteurella sp. PK-2025 TaxID=3413133 RepID=UPI003C786913
MTTKPISIVGADVHISNLLKEKADISTTRQLAEATRTLKDRRELANKTGISPALITSLAVQAELLRIKNMSPQNAFDLMNAGIYSIEDLKKRTPKEIVNRVKAQNEMTALNEEMIIKIIGDRFSKLPNFEDSHIRRELVASESKAPSMYANLSEMIAELGRGIGEAQRALDQSAIEVQNQILADDRLYSMGLQATWYTMPEAEFTLKMDYVVTEEKNSAGKPLGHNIKVVPDNATYSNYFKSERRESSSVRLRFLPIPMENRMLDRIYMPDLSVCKQVDEIIRMLKENGIQAYRLLPEEAMDWGDTPIQLVSQVPEAHTLMLIGAKMPEITVSRQA